MHTIAQEARSGSPHTNIKNQDTQSRSNPNIEVWDVNDVVFLESESKILGTVAAIDGPHVIVKVIVQSSILLYMYIVDINIIC